MTAQEILNSEDFKRCEAFHGHVCPGLSIGYRAAKAGMAWLKEKRAADEEVVAVVETDACSADAVQVLTGCTFGKGNFIFKDHGKMALTLFSRQSGQGVRLIVRPGAFKPNEEHTALIQKVTRGEASEAERERFQQLHFQRTCDVLEKAEEELFFFTAVHSQLPLRARIEPSEPCARCGEATMPSKMEIVGTEKLCRGCLASAQQSSMGS
jgi:formylmethanofuran dehydrogenase subunit E